jgi:hypothetical protein
MAYVIKEDEDSIVVAFPMRYINEDAPPSFIYEEETYYRDILEVIPDNLAGKACSCRRYVKNNVTHGHSGDYDCHGYTE